MEKPDQENVPLAPGFSLRQAMLELEREEAEAQEILSGTRTSQRELNALAEERGLTKPLIKPAARVEPKKRDSWGAGAGLPTGDLD